MISMQSSTHSSQMNTVGPAMSLRTSCCDLPQNEQYKVFFESPDLLMPTPARDLPGGNGSVYSGGPDRTSSAHRPYIWETYQETCQPRPPRAIQAGGRRTGGGRLCQADLPGSSDEDTGRLSTTSSTRPKSRASSADM